MKKDINVEEYLSRIEGDIELLRIDYDNAKMFITNARRFNDSFSISTNTIGKGVNDVCGDIVLRFTNYCNSVRDRIEALVRHEMKHDKDDTIKMQHLLRKFANELDEMSVKLERLICVKPQY